MGHWYSNAPLNFIGDISTLSRSYPDHGGDIIAILGKGVHKIKALIEMKMFSMFESTSKYETVEEDDCTSMEFPGHPLSV